MIEKKTLKVEVFESINRSQLLEVAQKIYNSCDSVEEKTKDERDLRGGNQRHQSEQKRKEGCPILQK